MRRTPLTARAALRFAPLPPALAGTLAACLLLAACKTNEPCAGPAVELELTFFAPEFVKSLLVTYEGAGTFAREIHEVRGSPRFEIVLRDAPPEEEVTVKISAYEHSDVRGKLLGEGSLGPLVIDSCERYELELSDRFILARDAGTDAAVLDDAGEDAGEDAGLISDTGADAGTPFDAGEPICATQSDDATLALFSFSNAEATGTVVTDEVSGITGRVLPAQGSVASTNGPNACGDAAAFFGFGYLSIPSDGLAPTLGSVDFYVRFDGATPAQRQGLVSRDAQGQALPGHLAFFRTCDATCSRASRTPRARCRAARIDRFPPDSGCT